MNTRKINELFSDERNGKLILPNFQRDFVWTPEQQKSLLATFLVELPISSILLLNGNKEDFNSRKLCFNKQAIEAKDECLYLLDGQQRLSTLKSIFSNNLTENWKDNWDNLFSKLRYTWFLEIKNSDEEEQDIFGYNNLKFDNKNLKKFTPSEVLDFIKFYKINKTTKKEFYHPDYDFLEKKSGNLNQLRNEKAEIFSGKYLVPLFGLSESNKLQEKSLEKIAKKRAEKIILEIDDIKDENLKLKRIKNVFDDDVETIIDFDVDKENLQTDLAYKWKNNVLQFLNSLLDQEISLIEIEKNEISRGIAIFETINKGGTPLDNFDLIVAKAAKKTEKDTQQNSNLTMRIKSKVSESIEIPNALFETSIKDDINDWTAEWMDVISENDDLNNRFKNQYLNLLSIFAHVNKEHKNIKLEHIKRDKIFEISAENINNLTDQTVISIVRALAFMNFRLGITDIKTISYELMVLPIAYILSNDERWCDKYVLDKLEYWYWSSIFSGRYREKQNIRCINDLKILCEWIINKNNEDEDVITLINRSEKVLEVDEYSDYETLIDSSKTPTAIYKNILGYVLSNNPYDLLPNGIEKKISAYKASKNEKIILKNESFRLKLEDHHLIPLGGKTKLGQLSKEIRGNKKDILNSVLNRTLISGYANGKIRDMNIDQYMEGIQDKCRISHFIPKNLKIKEKELKSDYHKRIIEKRYDNIYDSIISKLDNLKN